MVRCLAAGRAPGRIEKRIARSDPHLLNYYSKLESCHNDNIWILVKFVVTTHNYSARLTSE